VQRGEITLWMSEDAIQDWKPAASGSRGGQRKFSDHAIEIALMLRLDRVASTKRIHLMVDSTVLSTIRWIDFSVETRASWMSRCWLRRERVV
jgi:hypothetical protein